MAISTRGSASLVLSVDPLGFPWQTRDPFLFCVHHNDAYPAGNEQLGPAASLTGRNIGMDFEGKDGWRMYHGDVVPGFPAHPHRGFETVTLARQGYIDHSDSLGATARFGKGDVQWMTAGRGVVHSEMFPLVHPDRPNPVELFQIWLNLPSSDKLVEPHFEMLWSETIPRHNERDAAGRITEVTVVAGRLGALIPPEPPPKSWARDSRHDVAIWALRLAPGAHLVLPPAVPESLRTLYFFRGEQVTIGGERLSAPGAAAVRPDVPLALEGGPDEVEILLLQGKPIGEAVVQYGPFVMNGEQEIRQAIVDYQRTRFGGWLWQSNGPVHPRETGRFAQHADGRREQRS
jgi:quercetin 2,3-dioxygenase